MLQNSTNATQELQKAYKVLKHLQLLEQRPHPTRPNWTWNDKWTCAYKVLFYSLGPLKVLSTVFHIHPFTLIHQRTAARPTGLDSEEPGFNPPTLWSRDDSLYQLFGNLLCGGQKITYRGEAV